MKFSNSSVLHSPVPEANNENIAVIKKFRRSCVTEVSLLSVRDISVIKHLYLKGLTLKEIKAEFKAFLCDLLRY